MREVIRIVLTVALLPGCMTLPTTWDPVEEFPVLEAKNKVDAPVPEAENPDYDPSVHPTGYAPDPSASLKYVSDQYKAENKAP